MYTVERDLLHPAYYSNEGSGDVSPTIPVRPLFRDVTDRGDRGFREPNNGHLPDRQELACGL